MYGNFSIVARGVSISKKICVSVIKEIGKIFPIPLKTLEVKWGIRESDAKWLYEIYCNNLPRFITLFPDDYIDFMYEPEKESPLSYDDFLGFLEEKIMPGEILGGFSEFKVILNEELDITDLFTACYQAYAGWD